MANRPETRERHIARSSPPPSISPTPAIGACPELDRCVSASTSSERSVSSSRMGRASLERSIGSSNSRSSSANQAKRRSWTGMTVRRGYVRPQGTEFSASAQHRDSVLSLGSIAHLQYYFARTGLLDGKGGRLVVRKPTDKGTLDLSSLDTNGLQPMVAGQDVDSSYASMGSSPELNGISGELVESPIGEDEYFSDEDESRMLPPTASTYNPRVKPLLPPPSREELKMDLRNALEEAAEVLRDAKKHQTPPTSPAFARIPGIDPPSPVNSSQGWYEIQGMHILDIMTLAIRAARRYYIAHDQPARLSSIKPEKEIRAELLGVLDVLKRMATRNWANGCRTEERQTMETWVEGVYDLLKKEEDLEELERNNRISWIWLDDARWRGNDIQRELAFMKSMDPEFAELPSWRPMDDLTDDQLPPPFLGELRTGLRLVQLHNAVVKKSKRKFGAIPTFHTDTLKPYRCAENLRFWIKAAELRWEVILKVDVMGVVYGTDRAAWADFESAIWQWSKKVREEISGELES